MHPSPDNRAKWELVLQKLESGEMPPKGLPRPADADRKAAVQWIHTQFDRADAAAKPFAGRVTARRLNRAEYNNTVRDLLAVDFRPADDFPQDDSGYGFDTIGDALSLSPVLMEKYFAAAEKIARTAIFGAEKLTPTVVRHQPPYREGTDGGDNSRFLSSLPYTITEYDLSGLTLPSALHAMHTFPRKATTSSASIRKAIARALPTRSRWPSGSTASRYRPPNSKPPPTRQRWKAWIRH